MYDVGSLQEARIRMILQQARDASEAANEMEETSPKPGQGFLLRHIFPILVSSCLSRMSFRYQSSLGSRVFYRVWLPDKGYPPIRGSRACLPVRLWA